MHDPISDDRRGISKEGMAALGFAFTVAMMGVAGGLLMHSGDQLSDGGPILTAESGPIDASNERDGQWIRIRHESGDTIDVKNITINVSIPGHRMRATLHGLPTDGIRQDDYEGNHVFTIGPGGVGGAAVASGSDGQWAAGEQIALRIEPRRVDLQPGETVRVSIRYDPEKKQVYREEVDVV
jgi:hypothetical protein